MKILHISLMGPYTDNWSYQENILPKIQYQQGHTVTVIAPCLKHTNDGSIVDTEPDDYIVDDGVRVIRLPLKTNKGIVGKINNVRRPYKLYPLLCELSPDLIMVHGLGQGKSNFDIAKYLRKQPSCVLVGDVHMYATLAAEKIKSFKSGIIDAYNKYCREKLYPFYKKVFGITTACVDYAIKEYNLPPQKVELLPLGFDPNMCCYEDKEKSRQEFRQKYQFGEDDFLIAHGGKIIKRRKTPETIEAVMKIENPKVKLVIFGGIDEEMKPQVEPLIHKYSDRVLYLGSLTPEEYHSVYHASDMALFPGGQSVLWQQAIGCGLPILVGNDKDLDYLNRGGNAAFIDDTSAQGIYEMILNVLKEENFSDMKNAAENQAREFFSYERIAKLVTDCVD